MNIKIKLVDPSLPMPEYHTDGAVAFDIYSREQVIVPPFVATIIPTNLIVKIPKGYFLMLASRSSTPIKKKLMVANGIGVIDNDFCGDTDEIGFEVLNFSKDNVIVERGERIGQAIFVKIAKVEKFTRVESMKKKSRGGFGSTNKIRI